MSLEAIYQHMSDHYYYYQHESMDYSALYSLSAMIKLHKDWHDKSRLSYQPAGHTHRGLDGNS